MNQVRKIKHLHLRDKAQHHAMYVMRKCSPSKGYSPSISILPNMHNCYYNLQLPLPQPTPPFYHDIDKGVVPNRMTQGKER